MSNESGTIAARWRHSEETLLVSNCHIGNEVKGLKK